MALLVIIAFLGRHLRREIPWCNRVDSHSNLLELCRHELGQVDSPAFGCIVAEMALGVSHDSRHGADDNDRCCQMTVLFCARLEQGEKHNCAEVDRRDIGVVRVVPALKGFVVPQLLLQVCGLFLVWLCFLATDPSSGNEEIDVLFLGRQFLVHVLQITLLGDIVRSKWNNGTSLIRTVGLGCILENFLAYRIVKLMPLTTRIRVGDLRRPVMYTLAPSMLSVDVLDVASEDIYH